MSLSPNTHHHQIGFYFVWLANYTRSLLYPALVGAVVVVLQSSDLGNYDPECTGSRCIEWLQLIRIFYAMFVFMWATIYLELWKGKEAKWAYIWGAEDLEAAADHVRQDFVSAMKQDRTKQRKHLAGVFPSVRPALTNCCDCCRPVDARKAEAMEQLDVMENDLDDFDELYYYSGKRRFWKMVFFSIPSCLMVGMVILSMYFVFALTEQTPEEQAADTKVLGFSGTKLLSGMLTGVTIPVLNTTYKMLAEWLTDHEYHRTDQNYIASLILKRFAFMFFNSYFSLLWIAFYIQDIERLTGQLFGILLTSAIIINNFLEVLLPRLMPLIEKFKKKYIWKPDPEDEDDDDDDEEEEMLPGMGKFRGAPVLTERKRPELGLSMIDQYLEMIVQFGYLSLFTVSFPLAPVLALFNNLIEVRVDSANMFEFRRPIAKRISGIGVWYDILVMLAVLSVLSNLGLVYVSTLAYPEGHDITDSGTFQGADAWREKESLLKPLVHSMGLQESAAGVVLALLMLEHLVFAIKDVLKFVIPDEPVSVSDDKYRETYYLLKEEEYYDEVVLRREGVVDGGDDDEFADSDAETDTDDDFHDDVVVEESEGENLSAEED
jgi:anoctamin-8